MRARVRSTLLTAGLVLFAIAGWLYFAPSQIGGSTTYVITSGVSMEPRFHSGDLALVRPASQYRVGDIVAYRSSLLHVTVLHRILAIHGGRYVFKGDNNNFIDPVRATRSELIGALWLHIPHGGVVLKLVHTPLVAALLIGVVGVLCLIGAQETRRRRRRRRGGASGGTAARLPTVSVSGPVDLRPWLLGTAVAALTLLVAALFAFSQPTRKSTSHRVTFTQRMRFGYSAAVKPDAVYPDGRLHSGQPIFLRLIRRIELTSSYQLQTAAAHDLTGTEQLALAITGPSGWTRRFPIGRRMRFAGVGLRTATKLNLASVQGLLAQVGQLTGIAGDGGSAIALVAEVHVHGTLSGRPLDVSFAPTLNLELESLQVQPGGGAPGPGGSTGGFDQSRAGSVSVAASAPNELNVLGASMAVGALRPIALLGLLLSSAALVCLALLARLRAPFEETARIQARYRHLIVPIVAPPDALEQIPYDVTSIEALVRLAESGDRLILHHRDPIAETYFVNDDTGVYRYQIGPQRVVWGEWQPPRPPAGYEPEPPPGPPVAPRPAFLSAAPDVAPPLEPEPPPAGVPLSAYTATPSPVPVPVPVPMGQQLLARAAGRLARELVRGARRRRSGSPHAFSESGD